MKPSYRPHRHQPAPGLKPKQLGSNHKGRTFVADKNLETLRREVLGVKPTYLERVALNEAIAHGGKRNPKGYQGPRQTPTMDDILTEILGPQRRSGIDSLAVLMFELKQRLPLTEGELP